MKNFLLLCVGIFIVIFNQSCTNSEAAVPVSKVETTSVKPVSTEVVPAKVASTEVVEKRIYNKKLLPLVIQVRKRVDANDTYYNWVDYTSCNVGLFAQLCTKSSSKELNIRVKNEYSDYIESADKKRKSDQTLQVMSWKLMTNYYCGITGKPMSGIIGDLQKAGFTTFDISHLEYLDDKYILSKTDINTSEEYYYENQQNLVKYLKAWEQILTEQKN